jgi:hypothetical protein
VRTPGRYALLASEPPDDPDEEPEDESPDDFDEPSPDDPEPDDPEPEEPEPDDPLPEDDESVLDDADSFCFSRGAPFEDPDRLSVL